MKYKIGIFGSAEDVDSSIFEKADLLGTELAKKDIVLITGACSGLPYRVAAQAFKANKTEIWGYSPFRNLDEQKKEYENDDQSIYKNLIYIPESFEFKDVQVQRKYRNVFSTATCDAGIIISGRWGTMNEFTDLIDMGKVIGILTGTGGIADEIAELNTRIKKKNNAIIVFNNEPVELVQQIFQELELRIK